VNRNAGAGGEPLLVRPNFVSTAATAGCRVACHVGDRWERCDGEWKIARRVLVDEWSRLDELPAPMTPPAGRVGLRSKDDPFYTFRGDG
jgi:hypothetical protein